MSKELVFGGKKYVFKESANCYVSPYSMFMLEQYPLNLDTAKTVCDLGAGTGILGIVASSWNPKRIVMIDTNPDCYNIMRQNCIYNQSHEGANYLHLDNAVKCNDLFDTILCNPASLPNFINANSFCDGGELGIDMILMACDFANQHLSSEGKMYIIITCVLPYGLVKEKLDSLGLRYNVVAKKIIPFRDHYRGIKEWVDELNKEHEEMFYVRKNNEIYEELRLWEIRKGDVT